MAKAGAAAAVLCLAIFARADEVTRPVPQGGVIRIRIDARGESARMGDRTVPLFRQPDGTWLGLMPVTVTETPGAHTVEILDERRQVVRTLPVQVNDAHFRRQNIRVSPQMRELKPLPGEMEAVHGLQVRVSPERYWAEPFVNPTPDCLISEFGVLRFHNGKYSGNYHRGVDLASPRGRPVLATAAGVVRIARMFRLHGGTVGVDHGQGVSSLYIHLSRVLAKEGQQVKKGDVLAEVGATGFATGPHLHWGLYVNGLSVNPGQFVSPDPPPCR